MPGEPVTHIERPMLPWRPERLTECRLDASNYPTMTRDEALAKAKALGRTRFYMVTCITCIQTSQRYQTWDENPVSAMARECEHAGYRTWSEPDSQMGAELKAIAILIEAHRAEFDEIVAGLGNTVSLADRRRQSSRPR